ncbi:fibrillarin-like rRNA/tRNA 2'-O-methyltransferase [Candidatus Woesearchaeota archaeon]|nr:fibrillarin-like rRNA/tRNA 2'-O-methyltransferase [Candidatus Woesearchaeota archaeon]
MNKSNIFEVFEDKRRIYTINLIPGKTVYDEKLVRRGGVEYREWNPRKSKLAAAILRGCPNIFIRKGSVVLYLGSSTGTTVSHVSDIVGREGFIFAMDLAPVVTRSLVFVCKYRNNIAPVLADANKPLDFADKISSVDIIYQDIAQKNQLDIFLKNIDLFLKDGGYALLAVKARSINVGKNPKDIFREIKRELENNLIIIDYRELEPFQKDHCMFVCKKK